MVYFDIPHIDGYKVFDVSKIPSEYMKNEIKDSDRVTFSRLTNKNVDKIPQSNLKKLKIVDSDLDSFTLFTDKFPNIEHLSIEYSHIGKFQKLPSKLKKINILESEIENYKGFEHLTSLETLKIVDSDVPRKKYTFPSLRSLEIQYSYDDRIKLPTSKKLNTLSLIHIYPDSLDISNSKNVELRQFKENTRISSKTTPLSFSLTESSLENVKNIDQTVLNAEKLDLSFNELGNDSFQRKSFAKEIKLNRNNFTSTKFLENFPIAKKIQLNDNKIRNVTNIPSNVKELSIQNNRVPLEFEIRSTKLEKMNFSGSPIEYLFKLPNAIPTLKSINLRKCKLRSLEGFPTFPVDDSTVIDLRDNKLENFEGVGKDMFVPILKKAKYDSHLIKDLETRECKQLDNASIKNPICFNGWLNNQTFRYNIELLKNTKTFSNEEKSMIQESLLTTENCGNLPIIENAMSSRFYSDSHEYLNDLFDTLEKKCSVDIGDGLKIML